MSVVCVCGLGVGVGVGVVGGKGADKTFSVQ